MKPILAALTLGLVLGPACHRETRAEEKLEVRAEAEKRVSASTSASTSSAEVVTKVQEPTRVEVETRTERFDPVPAVPATPTSPAIPAQPGRTVTTEKRVEERGGSAEIRGSVAETASEARSLAETHAEVEGERAVVAETETSAGPGWKAYLWLLALLPLLLVAGVWAVRKFGVPW